MKTYCLLFILSLFSFKPSSAQSSSDNDKTDLNFEISIGASLIQFLNGGIRVLEQPQIALSYGSLFMLADPEGFNIEAGVYYQVLGEAEYSSLPPWYTMAGLNYFHFDSSEKYVYLTLKLGRKSYFSPNIGVFYDAGLYYEIWENEKHFIDFPLLPALSLGFFFNIR